MANCIVIIMIVYAELRIPYSSVFFPNYDMDILFTCSPWVTGYKYRDDFMTVHNIMPMYFGGYLGSSLNAIAFVQLNPCIPAMPVDGDRVPLVQQNRLVGSYFPSARATIEPV